MPKKSKAACKDGKLPIGKNGRCVTPKTKKCKDGKVPSGKNGRCVKVKSLKVKSLKVKTPVAALSKDEIRLFIHSYMNDIEEEDIFKDEEVTKFIDISAKRNLNKEEIRQALDDYFKDYGEFI